MSDQRPGKPLFGPTPHTATILASYNCSAACKHCCFDSHPGIKQRLSLAEIKRFILGASAFPSMGLVVFSGGECFLLGKDLDRAVEYASSLGLATRCVSNGFWAKTYEQAKVRLKALQDLGLAELNVSTGDHHQEFVPESNVVNAAEAAVSIGMTMVIVIEMQKERRVTASTLRRNAKLAQLLQDESFAKKLKIIESPWMPGSHEERIQQNPARMINRKTVRRRKGCESVLTTLVATPDPNRIGICCGLSRERIEELNLSWEPGQPLLDLYEQSSQEFMKIWLHVDGPEQILAWAGSIDRSIDWENRYSHRCHACLGVFNDPKVVEVIRKRYQERVDDVLLRYAVMSRGAREQKAVLAESKRAARLRRLSALRKAQLASIPYPIASRAGSAQGDDGLVVLQ